jgi:glycosyltransferase involved in cell wall biosynthesis
MSSAAVSPPNKLVFLTMESPFPPSGGAHIRDAHLIRIFSETMEVEILCFGSSTSEGDGRREESLPPGVKVTHVRRKPEPIWQRAVSSLRPEVQTGYCERMETALRERAEPGKLLWVSRLGMGKYLEVAKKAGYRTILDQHQVETHVLWNNAYTMAPHPRTAIRGLTDGLHAAQCGLYEGRVCQQSDAVVATSDLDASRLLKLAPKAPVHVIPNAIDCAQYAPLRSLPGKTILFSGTLNYTANIEGLSWFVQEVLPRLQRSLGPAVPWLVVAGSNPGPEIYRMLDGLKAELHADPPSLMPFLADAAVVIVPIRSGRSMRFKILEAMASGRSVVSTPRGADGLLLAPGYDVWIADAADKFASAVARLLESPELRAELGSHAAQTADARYDWKAARVLLDALLQRLGRRAPAGD